MSRLRLTPLLAVACLGGAISSPIPSKIEKLVCEVATQKQIEDKASNAICTEIAKKFPIPECQTVLEKLWDKIVAECPKGHGLTFPGQGEVEKLVCEVATRKDIEDKSVDKMCAAIKQKFPSMQFQPDCPTVLKTLWESIATKCPKGHEVAFPGEGEIEKLACEMATQKQIEEKATGEICSAITKKLPIPDCQGALEMLWDKIVAKCPKGRKVTFPGQGEIKDLVCKVATRKDIEDKEVPKVCAAIKEKFPIIQFQPDCPTVLKSLWDNIAATCPHGNEVTFPGKDEIKKLVCKVASRKDIEDKEVPKVCAAIKEKFPIIQFQPDCPTVLKALWDNVAATCPHGNDVTFPGKGEIEKLVCKVATQKQIEDKATGEICSEITKKLPIPDCQGVLEMLWHRIVAKCPKSLVEDAELGFLREFKEAATILV